MGTCLFGVSTRFSSAPAGPLLTFCDRPRQPEAKHLYLSTGYEPQFDRDQDPEAIKSLAFTKNLPAPPLS